VATARALKGLEGLDHVDIGLGLGYKAVLRDFRRLVGPCFLCIRCIKEVLGATLIFGLAIALLFCL
jgi:hypothetical protein